MLSEFVFLGLWLGLCCLVTAIIPENWRPIVAAPVVAITTILFVGFYNVV